MKNPLEIKKEYNEKNEFEKSLRAKYEDLNTKNRHAQLADIYGVEHNNKVPSNIINLFKKDFQKTRSQKAIDSLLIKYTPAIYLLCSTSTIINNFRSYRQAIKEVENKYTSYALEAFEPPIGLARQAKNRSEDVKRINRNARLAEDNKAHAQQVVKVERRIKALKKIVDKESFSVHRNQSKEDVKAYYVTFLLAYATGRRFSEILKTLSIKKRGDYYIYQGLLKGSYDQTKVRSIGLSPKEVIFYLKMLRKLIDCSSLTLKEVNSKYSRKFGNKLKSLYSIKRTRMNLKTGLKETYNDMHFHTIRAESAQAGSQLFGISTSDFLGHDVTTTGDHYN
jgi:hypothetical protein